MTRRTAFQTRDFLGIVHLQDWITTSYGAHIKRIYGRCSVYKDEEIVGFKSEGNNNANWVVRIEGSSGNSITILGCQIRAVEALKRRPERLVETWEID